MVVFHGLSTDLLSILSSIIILLAIYYDYEWLINIYEERRAQGVMKMAPS